MMPPGPHKLKLGPYDSLTSIMQQKSKSFTERDREKCSLSSSILLFILIYFYDNCQNSAPVECTFVQRYVALLKYYLSQLTSFLFRPQANSTALVGSIVFAYYFSFSISSSLMFGCYFHLFFLFLSTIPILFPLSCSKSLIYRSQQR